MPFAPPSIARRIPRLFQRATRPTFLVEGDLWSDTTDASLKVFAGGAEKALAWRYDDGSGRAFDIRAFGATDGGDITALVAAHAAEVAAAGGTWLVPPGWSVTTQQWSLAAGTGIDARGATITHSGDNEPLLLLGANDLRVEGGTWVAKQSATNPTTAVVKATGCQRSRARGLTVRAGDVDGLGARYAQYGVWFYARSGAGIYYDLMDFARVYGASLYGVFLDGWNEGNSLSYLNANRLTFSVVQRNGPLAGTRDANNQIAGAGVALEGCEGNTLWFSSESNQGPGLRMGVHAAFNVLEGWMEGNNQPLGEASSTVYPQIYTDPAAAAATLTTNKGVLRTAHPPGYGSTDTIPPSQDRNLGGTNDPIYWGRLEMASRSFFGQIAHFVNSAQFRRAATGNTAFQAQLSADANARFLMTAGGQLQWGDGTATPETTLGRTAAGVLTTDAATVIHAQGGLRSGNGTTVKKHQRVTATFDFPSIAAGATAELTVAVSGLLSTDILAANPISAPEAGLQWAAYPTTDTANVRLANVTSGAIDPASRGYRIGCWQY